jgi:hypothetical protein
MRIGLGSLVGVEEEQGYYVVGVSRRTVADVFLGGDGDCRGVNIFMVAKIMPFRASEKLEDSF